MSEETRGKSGISVSASASPLGIKQLGAAVVAIIGAMSGMVAGSSWFSSQKTVADVKVISDQQMEPVRTQLVEMKLDQEVLKNQVIRLSVALEGLTETVDKVDRRVKSTRRYLETRDKKLQDETWGRRNGQENELSLLSRGARRKN